MTLQRLVLTFKSDGLEARVLYRTQEAPGPGTKARRREVTTLVRTGLQRALEAFDGSARVDVIGTSGFSTREDAVLCTTEDPDVHKKRATTTKGVRT